MIKIIDLDKIVGQAGGSIPQQDFERFVKPYDSAKLLEGIQKKVGRHR